MKISDIRPENLLKKQREAVKQDIANIVKGRKKFVKVRCPACNGKTSAPVFEKYGFKFVECKGCLTIYNNPRPTYQMLKKYYLNSKMILKIKTLITTFTTAPVISLPIIKKD